MKSLFIFVCVFSCIVFAQADTSVLAQNASVESPSVETSIKAVGEVSEVHSGLSFTEGPAWEPKTQRTFFTDIPNNTIHVFGKDGKLQTFTNQSNHANGLMVAADGRLLACEMDGQVVAYDIDSKKRTVLASKYEGQRFNACNDLVIDKQGGIYFTDPLFRAPEPLPQKIQAVYYRDTDGDVRRVTEAIKAPNGIALSPDGSKLYVAPSQQAQMLVYDVAGPGELKNGKVFCELKQPAGKTDTGGDGMTVDVEGNLYFTTHLGVEIFSPAGKSIGLIEFPQQPANVTFIGNDRKTMIVTSRSSVYQVAMPIAGLAPN